MFTTLPDPKIVNPFLSAFDCVRKPGKAVYCSSELTSGRRWNRVLEQHGVKGDAALQVAVGEAESKRLSRMNMESNLGWSEKFANIVRYSQNEGTDVIDPGPLYVPGWQQPQYYALWETLIRTRVREVRFNQTGSSVMDAHMSFLLRLTLVSPRLIMKGPNLTPTKPLIGFERLWRT